MSIDEAQGACDRQVAGCLSNSIDLGEQTLDKLAAVTSGDEQPLVAGARESALHSPFRPALVAFRVDDPDPLSGDNKVVDVGRAVGNTTVVQNRHPFAGQAVEPGAEPLLADRPSLPCRGRGSWFGQGDRDVSEPTPLASQTLLVAALASFVLAVGRGPRNANGLGGRWGGTCGRPG